MNSTREWWHDEHDQPVIPFPNGLIGPARIFCRLGKDQSPMSAYHWPDDNAVDGYAVSLQRLSVWDLSEYRIPMSEAGRTQCEEFVRWARTL